MIRGQRHDSTTQRLRKSRPSLPRQQQQQQQKYHRKTSDVTASSLIKYNYRMIDTRSQWKFLVRNICICMMMLLIVRDVGRCCHQNENTATPTSGSTTITYHMIITVHSWTYHKHYNPIPIRRTTRNSPWTYTAVASSSSLLQNRRRRDESHYATAPQRSVEEEMSIDLDTVSDTEALLACYAYLQRKNVLSEWSTTQKRHGRHLQDDDDDDQTIGYFWENLNELRYYNNKMNHNRNINHVVYRQPQILQLSNDTVPSNTGSQNRNNTSATTTSSTTSKRLVPNHRNMTQSGNHPVVKSIEGTGYNYIENFVPGHLYDHSIMTHIDTADYPNHNVVAEVVATKMTTDLRLQQQNTHNNHDEPGTLTPIEMMSSHNNRYHNYNNNNNEQLPMYVNHPENVWDIIEDDDDDDIGIINDMDAPNVPPMYRKNYRIFSDNNNNNNNEYYMNHYNHNDDDTMEVLRFRRRSHRTQQLFHNTTWKEAWYARRWGRHRRRDPHDRGTYHNPIHSHSTRYDSPGTSEHNSRQQQKQEMKLKRRLEEKVRSSNKSRPSTSSTIAATKTIQPPFYSTVPTTTHRPMDGTNDNDNEDENMNQSQLSSTSTSLLFHSQLLSRMEDDVIADAIVTYIRANRKRSIRRKFTNQYRKSFLRQTYDTIVANSRSNSSKTMNHTTANSATVPDIPSSSMIQIPPQQLHHYHPIDDPTWIITSEAEQQRRRSERAKKAYQTRLQNEKLRQQQTNAMNEKMNPIPPFQNDRMPIWNHTDDVVCSYAETSSATPTAAYERMDRFLTSLLDDTAIKLSSVVWNNGNQLKLFHDDVELVLQPRKLSQRKELLLRIMRDLFQLRGMCIPVSTTNLPATSTITNIMNIDAVRQKDSQNDSVSSMDTTTVTGEYKFMTKASVEELGTFILQRIRDRINELEE